MPNIFLSHTSIDKPFVEKLARDLKRLGINVWFDKWEIAVGESITWKIEEGIQANEFLGVILSPEALLSEWVKSEISAAWVKQIKLKKIGLLPILYRNCEIPLFLADRKYADFRKNYNDGLEALAGIFGIKDTAVLSIDNWRIFANKRKGDWKKYRMMEFETLVTTLIDRALEYNWSCYVGGSSNEFSVQFSTNVRNNRSYITFKLKGNSNSYWVSFKDQHNPNRFKVKDFDIYIGNSINACEEFLWRKMDGFRNAYGDPTGKAFYFTYRFSRSNERIEATTEMNNKFNWHKGKNLINTS